jgi:methionyl-tRNA formyltransferase
VRLLLLAMTGMGNAVLELLAQSRVAAEILVVSRAEKGPYPYFPCEDLSSLCERLGVPCLRGADLDDPATEAALRAFAPDLGVSATFYKIIRSGLIALPPLGFFNIHPSLLPAYKGPMPTNWAIIHGERVTGVTIHELTTDVDEGRVALSFETVINKGETDGELRRRLYTLAGEMAVELLGLAGRGQVKLARQEPGGSRHPRVTSPEGLALLRTGGFSPGNVLRGVTPWPGAGTIGEALAAANPK